MRKRVFLALFSTLLLAIIGIFLYFNQSYQSEILIETYEAKNKNITIEKTDDGIYIDSKNSQSLVVFYPGAQIEIESYIPLLYGLAEKGISSFIVKMPLNLAILDKDAFNKISEFYSYPNYYLMGHSLGGAMAANYTAENDKVRGLILLAAYPTKKISSPLLSIYGSKDGVLNMDKYQKNREFWPRESSELIVDGGNHSYFGNYGLQKGDNKASISREEQQEITQREILKFIDKTKS